MPRYNWSALNTQQVGAYFEYFVKMELTMHGFEVYTAEVDDRGVDFVARRNGGGFIEVQVKALRDFGYIFMRKSHFRPKEGLFVAAGLLVDGKEPEAYFVPSSVWLKPSSVFVERNYDKPDQKSPPEWGLNFSRRNMSVLKPFAFHSALEAL